MTQFVAPPDAEVVRGLLYDLKDKLSLGDGASAATVLPKLKSDGNPQFVMQLLAPNLFMTSMVTSSSDATHDDLSLSLTQQESMNVLMFLATTEPGMYLKPASRAIKTFILRTQNQSEAEAEVLQVSVSDNLLQLMIAQLSGHDVEVSSNATEAVVACCRRLPLADRALAALFEAWKASWELKETDKQSATTICIRCANAIVEIWCLDAEGDTASLDSLVTMMTDSSDPLLQMSTLDLVEKLATTMPMHAARARWLYSSPVLQPLLQMAGANIDEPDPILGAPALRLLSSLAKLSQWDASLFEQGGADLLTSFHHALHNFDTSGEIDRLAMIDAISSFASASPDALELVLDDQIIRERWLLLAVAQPELKAAILYSIARVMNPQQDYHLLNNSNNNNNIAPSNNTLCMKLYATVGQCNGNRDVTEICMSLAQSPVPETRLGAYALLEAVARQSTGAQVLLSHPDFYDFLITRQVVETITEGKEGKYAIVVAVLQSDARGLLADKIVKALTTYVEQGPHYVQTQRWDVAVE
jgi:hypothetical protein